MRHGRILLVHECPRRRVSMQCRTTACVPVLLLLASLSPARAGPPDIILVTADALRADHLSVNGYPRATSPSIDAFARSAWHFADALTVIPKTGPSFATLF